MYDEAKKSNVSYRHIPVYYYDIAFLRRDEAGMKQAVEGNTRPFTVFADVDVREAFAAAGFTADAREPEFVLPMAVHRALGVAPLSRALEGASSRLGLRKAVGSPVILRAVRRG